MNTTQANIRALRASGFSQDQIAKEIGTSQALLSRWESGKIPPAVQTAEKISTLADSVAKRSAKKRKGS